MKKNKLLALLLTLALTVSLLAACGGAASSAAPASTAASAAQSTAEPAESTAGGETDPAADGEKVQIYLVIKNRGDMSYWDSIAAGGDRAKAELADRADVFVVEAEDVAENLTAMYEAADAGADLIISAGDYRDNMAEIAAEYPELAVVTISETVPLEAAKAANNNVYGIDFVVSEAAYLAGIAAADRAAQDGSNTIGFIGGTDENPVIQEFLVGYIQGAKYVNPEIDVKYVYVGAWNDPDKARTQAEAMYNDAGADVIFACAGGSGTGVHDAAANVGKFVVGVDSDQSLLYTEKPEIRERFLTSVLKKCDNAVYDTIEQFLNEGTLPFGEMNVLGVAEDAVGVIENDLFEANVSAEGKEKLQQALDGISSGEISVWSAIGKEQDEIQGKIAELLQ